MLDWSSHLMKSINCQCYLFRVQSISTWDLHMEQLKSRPLANRVSRTYSNLHKWQNGAIQLSEKSLLLLAIMSWVPIEDVEPGEPDTLGLWFGRRTDNNSILDYWLGDLFGVASDIPTSLGLLVRGLDFEPIVGSRLRSH
jgi:hypothetical protein